MDLEANHGVFQLPAISPNALKEKLSPLMMTTPGEIFHVCFVVVVTSRSISHELFRKVAYSMNFCS